MKTRTRVFYFAVLLAFIYGCSIDDVNQRFQESMSLNAPASITVPDPNNFSFVHITDTHVVDGVNRHLSAAMGRLISTDAFIINSGDLTENGQPSDFTAYQDILGQSGLPFYSAPGNHDLWSNGWNAYKNSQGPGMYSVVAGNVRLIVLDTANDTLGSDQYTWLQNELQSKTESLCVVVAHYNFFSPTIMESGVSTNMEEMYGMMRMFEKYHVNYVLLGHSHIYDFRTINGVSYLVGSALKDYGGSGQKYFNRIIINNGVMTHEHVPVY